MSNYYQTQSLNCSLISSYLHHLLHIYIHTGNIKETALEISKFDGVLSSSVHVGNSDIVAEFIYEDSEQLIDTIVKIKRLESVERVLWSEEVFTISVDPNNIVRSFKKIWITLRTTKTKTQTIIRNNNSRWAPYGLIPNMISCQSMSNMFQLIFIHFYELSLLRPKLLES